MQLEKYINDLLYRYECVIIPGFGALLTQRLPACIYGDSQTFHPPSKTLSFNAQLTGNDGLLANYIAKTEEIPHEQANANIHSYVRKLRKQLRDGVAVALPNIGEFTINASENLEFLPFGKENYLATSFGLSPFESPAIAREVYKEQVVALEKKAPNAITPERKASHPYLKYAAIGLLVLGVGGALGVNHLKNIEDYNITARQEAENKLESKIQEATFTIENPLPAITLTLAKPSGRYHIIAGAFRVPENAETRVQELRDKGYPARQIGKNRYGLHQVVYGSYTDSQEALKELRKVRVADNRAAWLLVKKLAE